MSRLSNKYLILVPIINIILNLIYITNQYFDFFTELDLIGNYFSLLKLDNDNISVSHFIFGYLMLESFLVLIYVLFVINIEDEKILKFICSDKSNKLDRNCISEIIHDIFTYTMFIKFIACVIFLIVMQFVKTKQGGDNMTTDNANGNVANTVNANGNAANTVNANAANAAANAVAPSVNNAETTNVIPPVNIPERYSKMNNTAKLISKQASQYGTAADVRTKTKDLLKTGIDKFNKK